jgi:hypothetical protein
MDHMTCCRICGQWQAQVTVFADNPSGYYRAADDLGELMMRYRHTRK